MDNEILQQNLRCPICLAIADDPYESSCCGHLFCNKCIKSIKHLNCPICRSSRVNFRENFFIRNLFNNVGVICPYGCKKSIQISHSKLHRYECEEAMFKCEINNCQYEGKKDEATQHFLDEHCDQMVILSENFASLKNTYDKHSIFDKINKIQKKEFKPEYKIYNLDYKFEKKGIDELFK